VLTQLGVRCTFCYGSMDAEARIAQLQSFRKRAADVLIVTDVAARGLDIPLLDNVINYDFPPSPKLFVHRVGRVARAGRSGTSFSLVTPDEARSACLRACVRGC
jgi:ATP-dependent RNA helicase DDX54/DBP10